MDTEEQERLTKEFRYHIREACIIARDMALLADKQEADEWFEIHKQLRQME